MPITSVTRDPEQLTLTVVADFPADVARLWEAYCDPRQLERFWGPPTFPATFTRHDATPGGRSSYTMTGPDGATHGGYWEWVAVEAQSRFEVLDGFTTASGDPDPAMPSMRLVFEFDSTATGSRVRTTSHFGSLEDLEQLLESGMEEGMRQAMGQMDEVLADLTRFAVERGTEAQALSETTVRISRVLRGSLEAVWAAHHEADLVRRWMLGPDGWTMPVCQVATEVGEALRYEWEPADGSEGRFGFEGELLEVGPGYRSVSTERWIGTPMAGTLNEMTLTPVEAGTLLVLVTTYPDAATREAAVGSGMVEGMETSYARLERELLVTA